MKFLLVCLLLVGASLALPQNKEKGKRLIKVNVEDVPEWLDESEIAELQKNDITFLDITERTLPTVRKPKAEIKVSDVLQFQSQIKTILPNIQMDRTDTFLRQFTSYHNRWYTTADGRDSALWLFEQVQTSIEDSNYTGNAEVALWTHETTNPAWIQPSIIARIEGSDPALRNEIVILGAHLDSVNRQGESESLDPAPGADDNASGCAVLLETLRTILDSNFIPKRTLEFQFYAAEEDGLLGSAEIAESYSNDGKQVVSMMNFDVSGYFNEIREIGIMWPNTSENLSAVLRLIVEEYLGNLWTWIDFHCPVGTRCSDHSSFFEYGFPTVMPASVTLNPHMHHPTDRISIVNPEQLMQFTKIGVAYAMEFGEISSLESGSTTVAGPALSFSILMCLTTFLYNNAF